MKFLTPILLSVTFLLGSFAANAQDGGRKGGGPNPTPQSIIHVITFKFKDGVSEADQQKVWDATRALQQEYRGISRVWVKALKVQGPDANFRHAIVMEFRNQKAFDDYADAPAHKKWEAVYLPLRGESRTHDITN